MSMLTPLFERTGAMLEKLHPMPQNPVSIQLPVLPARIAELEKLLAKINKDPADNPLLPMSVFDTVHFSRFLLVDGPEHPEVVATTLIFMANVDGPVDQFLQELVALNQKGLDAILRCCEGYPSAQARSAETRLDYLQRFRITTQTFYVNTVGRDVRQIRQEDELFAALQLFLNGLDTEKIGSSRALRGAVIDFVGHNPELAWALATRPGQSLAWRTAEKLRFAALAALGLMILAWAWPVLLAWVLTLRKREQTDPEENRRASLERIETLRAAEDFAAHNPFAAIGFIKSGWLRRTTAQALLASAQVVLRHVFNKGNLAGIPVLGLEGVDTIHFARWTMLDGNTRVLFTSNYDGSLESYMVDFIDKVAWGLNLIFSNGVGYPRTRWLVHEGARKEQMFKDYLSTHQIENQAWFSAYPHLTAVNIANNAEVRMGLHGHMSEQAAQRWAARL